MMVKLGDIVEVTDLRTGGTYDAVVRWIPDAGPIRCEWLAGPYDGEDVWIERENQEF